MSHIKYDLYLFSMCGESAIKPLNLDYSFHILFISYSLYSVLCERVYRYRPIGTLYWYGI